VFKKPGKYVSSDITVIRNGNGMNKVYKNEAKQQVEDIGRKIGLKRVKRDLWGNKLNTLDGRADSVWSHARAGSPLREKLGHMTIGERRLVIIELMAPA